MKKRLKNIAFIGIALLLVFTLTACGASKANPDGGSQKAEKNGEVYILFTSDVHCGIDKGFGYTGLAQVRNTLEAQGYTTILVDNGDSIQGESIGTLSNGSEIIKLMNELKYDVAIPGNHEFDYGMEEFLKRAEEADFPYISCNFNKDGELLFDRYIIKEVAGMKIAFVGVTTPWTVITSTPAFFQNEQGSYIYGFMQDESGELLYKAVQDAVNDARADGADYVYVLGHLGLDEVNNPWSYADVIENTNGIDVFLDGHSHDTEQVQMKNKDGDIVVRSACGTKLNCIGYSHISPENGIVETGIWTWNNSLAADTLLGFKNDMTEKIDTANKTLDETLGKVVASTTVDLTINDPVETDTNGAPIRMIRRAETNLGDLCPDALRVRFGTDISILNGGGIRANINKGDITFKDIISVFPFGNMVSVVECTGEQILNALEWGASKVPLENGGFLQVSGMSYEIDLNANGHCLADEMGMFSGYEGEHRVRNIMVGSEPLDLEKTYTVAGTSYVLLEKGDGMTAFDGCKVLQESVAIDNQVLIDYIVETLGGVIGSEYADPYGQGRITIIDVEQ